MSRLRIVYLLLGVASASSPNWKCDDCGDGCCCMFCAGNGNSSVSFECKSIADCFSVGGQCKHDKQSSFTRSEPARLAPRTLLSHNETVEQVHLISGRPEEMIVVYVTQEPTHSEVEVRRAGHARHTRTHWGTSEVYSAMQTAAPYNGWSFGWVNGYDDELFPVPPKKLWGCGPAWSGYNDPDCVYTSGYVHKVVLDRLQPGTEYEYLPRGSHRWRRFKTSPAVGEPISFGVVADLGQTRDSLGTMVHMKQALDAGEYSAVIFPGDISYADGYGDAWDTYGRLSEFLWESVPAAYGVGNHEYANEQFVHYTPRYPVPTKHTGSNLWYSFEAGMAHVIMLCSYCVVTPGSPQHQFLQQDLASIDRRRTPWVVVSDHVPWYSSNGIHPMTEAAPYLDCVEDLLHIYKVDIVFSGHVHAYERTVGVYKGNADCDGPVYVTIGDGGNHEGPECPWIADIPAWSAFREFSFGHGILDIHNRTHALWTWHRNQDNERTVADRVVLRPVSERQCQSVPVVV